MSSRKRKRKEKKMRERKEKKQERNRKEKVCRKREEKKQERNGKKRIHKGEQRNRGIVKELGNRLSDGRNLRDASGFKGIKRRCRDNECRMYGRNSDAFDR